MDYLDPKTKHLFRNVPVRQGPESVVLEQIRLPFWYGGPQYEVVEAGFGPFALSRLATATGGIYFITRFDTRRMGFDPARMREYQARLGAARRLRERSQSLTTPTGGAQGRADHPAKVAGNALHGLSSRGWPRVQRCHGDQPGDRRTDRLHGRRGFGPDQRGGQAIATTRSLGAGRPTST